jgi:hypothetical protein
MEQTEAIHQALHARGLSPSEHLLDAGYVDAGIVLQSRECLGIEVIGPVSQHNQWQARAGKGYDLSCFRIDWQKHQATCQQGKESVKWTPHTDQHGHPKIAIRFGLQDCRDCPTALFVPVRPRLHAFLLCARKPNLRSCKMHASINKQKCFVRDMLSAQGLKERIHRP